MKQYAKSTLSAIAGVTMIASMTAAPALAAENGDDAQAQTPAATQNSGITSSDCVFEEVVEGDFSFDQTAITPNSEIKTFFNRVASAVCGAYQQFITENPLQWRLKVTGAVDTQLSATINELIEEDESESVLMTCSCGGNTAGGRAIITADVDGISVSGLLQMAGLQAGANTVTFISSDGTSVAMPLTYVIGHHAVLSYAINGEDLSASVGGNNQLWLVKTPANYFVRDVVEIAVSAEDEAPANPGENDEHPNSPNAGILAAL